MSSQGRTKKSDCAVNIVIPVYRDLQVTRRCLDSVLASELPANASITVIEDASPESELRAYCQALLDKGRVKLLVNEENRGFVATANRGFTLDSDADVLLLNSDTEVAGDWLQRLRTCAYRDEKIGTVTPFSNNGTICSYPLFPESGLVPGLWDAANLDELFRSANPRCYAEIPTAVGFCMYIKRQCLNDVGNFDEDSFGLGYGEECDFSMRGQAKGWKNVIAADVFVYHKGAVSFAEQSCERKEKADIVMQELHPDYDKLVARFIRDDPLSLFRHNVDSLRLARKPEDAANLLEESVSSHTALKKRATETYDLWQNERKVKETQEVLLRESLEKSVWLKQELAKCVELSGQQKRESLEKYVELSDQKKRELSQFGEIEKHINAENKSLHTLLRQSRFDFTKTDVALAHAQQHVAQIKQSRSWRYTAWLRKLTGSL